MPIEVAEFDGSDSRVVAISLSREDLNEIKRRSRLATSDNTTFVSLQEGVATDAAGNRVSEVPSNNATAVSNYTEDSSPPRLMSFNVDLDRGRITFRFSETVDNRTFELSSFTLQDSCPAPPGFMEVVGSGFNASNSTSNATSAEPQLQSYTFTRN